MVRLSGPLAAVQFLTRIPIRLRREPSLAAAVPWFPFVGGLIGAVVGGAAAGLWHLVPAAVAGAVAVLVGVLITGAFHEDGLADIADAFGGGWTVERRKEIMKDPRHGSYGVAALSGSILLRAVALGSLPGPAAMFAGAVAAHALARGAAVGVMRLAPPADRAGLGADYARGLSTVGAVAGVGSAIAIAALTTGWWVGPLALGAIAAAGGVVWLAVRKIGGISGDVLGAVEQVAECVCLVIVTGLATDHVVWWA